MNKSRLDTLWGKFEGVSIQDTPSEIPSNNIILSETAISNLIRDIQLGSSGVVDFKYKEHPSQPGVMQLLGYNTVGQVITSIDIPAANILYRQITQEDVDNGIDSEVGDPCLEFSMHNTKKVIPLPIVKIKTGNTKSIKTELINDTVKSEVIIDEGNAGIVELKTSNSGLYAKVNLDDSGSVILEETINGLKAKLCLEGTEQELKVRNLTWEQYTIIPDKDPYTLYIISNKPLIYFNGQIYGQSSGTEYVAGDNITIEDNVISADSYDDSELKSRLDSLESDKVDKEDGKGLSTEDFTNDYKGILDNPWGETIE